MGVRQRRELVHKEITHQESEKGRIEKEMQVMQEQVRRLHDSIECKKQSRIDYDKTIGETEAAYMKILESSQTLLHVLKRETQNLTKNQTAAPNDTRRITVKCKNFLKT